MKRLICEMCGSMNLIKKEGVFVCENCGVKYSVDEVKKMMIEGVVDVSGSTIKVDNTASINNYYKLAEIAYNSQNKKEAEYYCNKIIEISPNNYKAWLLKGCASGWQSTLANVRIEESANCFKKALSNAPEEKRKFIKNKVLQELKEISRAIIILSCNSYLEFPSNKATTTILSNVVLCKKYAIDFFDISKMEVEEFKKEVAKIISNTAVGAWNNTILKDYLDYEYPSKFIWETFKKRTANALLLLQLSIETSDCDDMEDIKRYKNIITITEFLIDSCSYKGTTKEYTLSKEIKEKNIDNIMKCHQKIKEIDSTYVIPERPSVSGGCYIATAVYSSYDCPEVWVLRRYRDFILAKTWGGRIFIYTYYAISPMIVKVFGKERWFKIFFKDKLDSIVSYLKNNGFEDTPYKDKKWY